MITWDPRCPYCGDRLSGAKHGWVTVQMTSKEQARVHTVCRGAFERLGLDEQLERHSVRV